MKRIFTLLTAVFVASLLVPCAKAQYTVKTLVNFNTGGAGSNPESSLVFDAAGSLYGTTAEQTNVFQLSPNSDGTWTENVLWTSAGGSDPSNIRPGIVFDSAGNIYATSYNGGTIGCGTVFKLTHNSGGNWSESNLVSFGCGFNNDDLNGALPVGGVTLDSAGNLYGGTTQGGTGNNGVIYQLTPNSDGSYTENVIHNFTGGNDGAYPDHPFLIFDSKGNLYGSAALGGEGNCTLFGTSTCGTIFEMTPQSGGTWSFKVIHTFTGGTDGGNPEGTLVFDKSGNLYGTTYSGGQYGFGVAFKLIPHANGKWGETVLHAFNDKGGDGTNPLGGVIFDSAGSLYGTTTYGGTDQCFNAPGCGVVYKLTPKSSGGTTETILARFHGAPNNGPYNDLLMDGLGNIYGTCTGYNTYSNGSVYELIK